MRVYGPFQGEVKDKKYILPKKCSLDKDGVIFANIDVVMDKFYRNK